MNEKQQKPNSVFGFGFRPTVSVYSVSVSAKNFHFAASLVEKLPDYLRSDTKDVIIGKKSFVFLDSGQFILSIHRQKL